MLRIRKSYEARMPKPFDLLASLASFARAKGIPLNDPKLVQRYLTDASSKLEGALADRSLLHGSRTERLFEATVLSLGRFRLLKCEDAGRVHSAKTLRAPDFRIVLESGEQWLVEVKNVRCEDPRNQQTTMSAAYLRSLEAYAEAVCTPLRLAFYWSRWGIWTVISPQHFRKPNGGLRVRMTDALIVNEFGELGDVSIMTRPPLRFAMLANKKKPRTLSAAGEARFEIASTHFFSGSNELTDPRERKLAEILFFYGEWPSEGPFPLLQDGEITGVEYVSAPVEPSEQGFDGIGFASQIFGRYYAMQTIDGTEVVHLAGHPSPDWFAPLAKWHFGDSKLPLWLGHMKPSPQTLAKLVASRK